MWRGGGGCCEINLRTEVEEERRMETEKGKQEVKPGLQVKRKKDLKGERTNSKFKERKKTMT